MGRSVYLCPNLECLKAAQKKDRLSRSLKVKVDAAVYGRLAQRLETIESPDGATNLAIRRVDVTPID